MRVLWLIDSLTLGGAEALVGRFAHAVDPGRVQMQAAFLKRIGGNPYESDLCALGVPCADLAARHLRDLSALRRLVRLVREERIDLVHAHLTYAAIYGALAARLTGRPLVATLHTAPTRAPAWSREGLRERIMCRLLDRRGVRVVAVSGFVAQAFERRGRTFGGRLRVVHNGIDGRAYACAPEARAAARRDLGLGEETLAVLTVAALREAKGLEVLLRAARTIARSVEGVAFLVAGEGERRGELERRAQIMGLAGRVRFLGFRRDVPALLAAADLFVLPSLEDAFPTVLLEAMAAGLPVVASEVGGIPEIVDAPRCGRLVPAGDEGALAEAVAGVLTIPAPERAALGKEGRRRVRERFSMGGWCEALASVYDEAAADLAGAIAEREGPR